MNLAKALGASRSGYHAHLHKYDRPCHQENAQLAMDLHAAFSASSGTYGSPRLKHALRFKGLRHGNIRIARLMREQQNRVRQKRRFVPPTTVVDKDSLVAPNYLLERSEPKRLNEI